jgi:KaiC/GvpD/RAD55 family RecA-like ATPase
MNANAKTRGTHEPVDDRLLAPENESVLVTGGSKTGRVRTLCRVARNARQDGRDVLFMTAREGAVRLRAALQDGVAVVDCTPSGSREGPNVASVGSPADLTGTSIPVSEFFESAGEAPVVLVDSLSTFLVYADEGPLFRFLQTVALHVRSEDGWLAVGLNPGAHEERTLRTFQQIFDRRERLDDALGGRDGETARRDGESAGR